MDVGAAAQHLEARSPVQHTRSQKDFAQVSWFKTSLQPPFLILPALLCPAQPPCNGLTLF